MLATSNQHELLDRSLDRPRLAQDPPIEGDQLIGTNDGGIGPGFPMGNRVCLLDRQPLRQFSGREADRLDGILVDAGRPAFEAKAEAFEQGFAIGGGAGEDQFHRSRRPVRE